MSKQVLTTYLLLSLAVVSMIIHNLFYAFFATEEFIFLGLTLLFLVGFTVSVVVNVVTYAKKKEPKDLWKLGWLGFFGILGIIPGFSFGLLGFFGFFGFLGQQK